jgi:gliding motility-associated-like protein
MKKFLPLLFLLIFHFSSVHAQSWLWGVAGYGPIKSNDNGVAVATDKHGNAYITGQYQDGITFVPFTLHDTSNQAYLIKYNSAGTALWARQSTSSTTRDNYSIAVATDTGGNIYITGYFQDSTITFGTHTLVTPTGAADVLLVKYDASGNVLWAKQSSTISTAAYFSGSFGYSVATDIDGNAFITGLFDDTITFGSYKLTAAAGLYNAFIVKYDPAGNVLWARQSMVPSSLSGGYGYSVTCDRSGNAYITGSFNDTISFGPYTLKSTATSNVFFITKYDAGGNVVWAKQSTVSSGASSAIGYNVTTDKASNVYVTGSFTDNIAFDASALKTKTGGSEYFLTKYDPSGKVLWAEQSNNANCSTHNSLSSDAFNNIYMVFQVIDSGKNMKFSNYTCKPAYPSYIFLSMMDSAGKVICSSILNNYTGQYPTTHLLSYPGNSIASDSTGKYIYTAGALFGDTVTCGPDVLTPPNGGTAPYLARWQSCCQNHQMMVRGDTDIPLGGAASISASGFLNYIWSPSAGISCATCPNTTASPNTNTTYTVIGTDSLGCQSYATVTVDLLCSTYIVPNVFTPNGDGKNDNFLIDAFGFSSYHIEIYDRWGILMFTSDTPDSSWDGRNLKGQIAPDGVYYYIIKSKCGTNERNYNGFVQVIE